MLEKYLRDGLRHPVPQHANPADHALDLINTDFISDPRRRETVARQLAVRWAVYSRAFRCHPYLIIHKNDAEIVCDARTSGNIWKRILRVFQQTWILVNRNSLNYSRNLLAYGVRAAMYCESSPSVPVLFFLFMAGMKQALQ